jgi:hypothetical protein
MNSEPAAGHLQDQVEGSGRSPPGSGRELWIGPARGHPAAGRLLPEQDARAGRLLPTATLHTATANGRVKDTMDPSPPALNQPPLAVSLLDVVNHRADLRTLAWRNPTAWPGKLPGFLFWSVFRNNQQQIHLKRNDSPLNQFTLSSHISVYFIWYPWLIEDYADLILSSFVRASQIMF